MPSVVAVGCEPAAASLRALYMRAPSAAEVSPNKLLRAVIAKKVFLQVPLRLTSPLRVFPAYAHCLLEEELTA